MINFDYVLTCTWLCKNDGYLAHSKYLVLNLYTKYLPIYLRHVSRSENLGGRAVRGGAKNLVGALRTGPKIWWAH